MFEVDVMTFETIPSYTMQDGGESCPVILGFWESCIEKCHVRLEPQEKGVASQ
jgi:hypothetical protein